MKTGWGMTRKEGDIKNKRPSPLENTEDHTHGQAFHNPSKNSQWSSCEFLSFSSKSEILSLFCLFGFQHLLVIAVFSF